MSAATRLVARDTALVAPGYIVPGLVSLLLVGALFTALGAAEYGSWALMFAIASGVPLLTTSSVEALTLRYRHRAIGGRDRRDLVLSLLATAVVAALAAVILLPDPTPEAIVSTSVLSVAIGSYLIRVAQLRADLRFGASSMAASLRAVTGGVLAAVAAAAVGTAAGAAFGMSAGFGLAILLSLGRSRPGSTGEAEAAVAPADPEGDDRRAYGLASVVVAVALFVLSVGDRFILSAFRPMEDVGVYAAVYNVVDLIIRLGPAVLTVAVRTRIFRAWDTTDHERLTAWVGSLFAVVLWASAILSTILVVVARWWLPGADEWALVGPIAFGLTAAAVAAGISFLYSASERQVRLAVHVVGAAVLNVVLNLVWIPAAGAQGAAIATLVSFSLLLAAHVLGLGRAIIPARAEAAIWALAIATGAVVVGAAWESGAATAITAGLLAAAVIPVRSAVRRALRPPESVVGST